MGMKQQLRNGLTSARRFTEGILRGFKTPAQWTHQVHPRANHALWFAGHMGVVDNFFIWTLDRAKVDNRPEYQEKFGMGSQPTSDVSHYPPVEEVLAYMRQRRETLLSILEALDESDLAKPTPQGTPDFLPDFCTVFQTAAWHEGMHCGQITVAHRAIGNEPITRAAQREKS